MEKSKFVMIGVIVFLSIILFVVWNIKHQTFEGDRTNWQWSNNWNSDQTQSQPPINRPDQQPPINPNQPMAQNFEQAKQISQQSGKPVLAFFGASWCNWCKKIEQETLTDESVRAAMANYVYIKIDADTNKNLVSQYKVRGLPTFFIMDSNGTELKKESGFMDANKMREFLK